MKINKIEVESTELFRNQNSNYPDFQKAVAFTDESKYPKEIEITVGQKGSIDSLLPVGSYQLDIHTDITNFKNLKFKPVFIPIKS